MIRLDSPIDPELEALLARGKVINPVPDVIRARSLARARATITAAIKHHPEPLPPRWRRVLPIALAASVALAVGTAGAVVALRGRAPRQVPPAETTRPIVAPPARAPVRVPAPAVAVVATQSTPTAIPRRPVRPASLRESYAAELDLLQRAQVAYASRSFTGALVLVAEHRRRFPNGRLAEEREALRVRSLAGAGRSEQATRAARAFAERFPRSAFLPSLGTRP